MRRIIEGNPIWKAELHPCISVNTALEWLLYHYNGRTSALKEQIHHHDGVSFALEAVLPSILTLHLIYSLQFLLSSFSNS